MPGLRLLSFSKAVFTLVGNKLISINDVRKAFWPNFNEIQLGINKII